jgi:hypothetical protein
MMDLDSLKEKWAEYDRKLDDVIRLNRRILTATTMNRARSSLQRMAMWMAVESVVWFVLIVALGSFTYKHIALSRFALAAVFLDLYAIANLIFLIRQIAAALGIDYGMPVSAIQSRLEALRMQRTRYIEMAVLAGMLGWTPFVIVVLKVLFDIDAYSSPGVPWLAANLLFSVAVVVMVVVLTKRIGNRMSRTPVLQRLMQDLAGYNLNDATGFLATLAEFDAEDGKGDRADAKLADDRSDSWRSPSP